MGRKNKYAETVEPHLSDIQDWIRTMTEKQIAKRLGISESSMEKYKKAHPELREALQNGREYLRVDVMSALIKKALGQTVKTQRKHIKIVGGVSTTEIDEVETYYPPDTAALSMILKNIDPNWHNDDQATLDLKAARLEIERMKAEQNIFE